jgi:peroxiredoxin Q/BCP
MSKGTVEVGSVAPEFALPDQSGKTRRLSDYRGKSSVVLFFYPKDYTPVCTMEAMAFRDSYLQFQQAGAEVIGVSGDSQQSHANFCGSYDLPFPLLTDESNSTRDRYGAGSMLGSLGARVTFVIDKSGVIQSVYRSGLRAKKHVEVSLQAASALADS